MSCSSPGSIGVNGHCATSRPPSETEQVPGARTRVVSLVRWMQRVAQTSDAFGSYTSTRSPRTAWLPSSTDAVSPARTVTACGTS